MTARLPVLADVVAAADRIRGVVRTTPLWPAEIETPAGPVPVLLKLEQLQLSGSFKARGAFNSVLRLVELGRLPAAGLVIASGGNAGIAAALAGRHAGAPVTVFVPTDTPAVKVDRLRSLGATVRDGGPTHPDTHLAVAEFVSLTGAAAMHPYDTFDMVAGAGTLALELDGADHGPVVVAVGGGGLGAGIAAVGRDRDFEVIGVEPTGAPSLHEALKAGRPVPVVIDTIAVDSLGARVIGDFAFAAAAAGHVRSVLVSDEEIVAARGYIWDQFRLAVENSAAAVVASVLSGSWRPDPVAGPPVLVLCGANLDDPHRTQPARDAEPLVSLRSSP
ncbi:pyridoxal-phosphate dependent enzyme [Jiangella muralis]|uniref:pyridoxal-phosphate dependent enzyme n=1 Tax=Jiangella muralis TaxID=702383 RepID=UPI0009F92C87|nr:pyridoxal-phosphate dependent enzyme [Jiangella muralis]